MSRRMKRFLTLMILVAIGTFVFFPKRSPDDTSITVVGPSGVLGGRAFGALSSDRPIVLIIPGSGPTDLDGNNPGGVAAATYRKLAAALHEQGVSSVRIDKRGMFTSAGAGDPNAVTLEDYVADVRSWVLTLAKYRPCVFLAGHSEGGLVAIAAAISDPTNICGIVLLATPGRPASDTIRQQLRANPANASIVAEAETIIAALERGERIDVSGAPPALQQLFFPEVQDFLISLFAFDPAAALRTYGGRTLIIQGGRDLQVPQEDAQRLLAASPQAEVLIVPNMNHVLKMAPEMRALNLAVYIDPTRPLAPGVSDRIAEFVKTDA